MSNVVQLRVVRSMLSDPEIASAADLALASECDEEHESALWGVANGLRERCATSVECAPVWRRLLGKA